MSVQKTLFVQIDLNTNQEVHQWLNLHGGNGCGNGFLRCDLWGRGFSDAPTKPCFYY